MDWTSLYFKTNDLKILILGTGEVATRRAKRFLNKNAQVVLIGNYLDDSLKGAILKDESEIESLVKWSDLIIVATENTTLIDYVTKNASDKLINRADNPNLGNLIVPTTFNIDDIEISIFTGGQSPLMAKELRKKIQKIITPEDILKIKIQNHARELLKEKISHQKERRDYLYSFLEDEDILEYITNNDLDGALKHLDNLIEKVD